MSFRRAIRPLLALLAGLLATAPEPLAAQSVDPAVVGERLQRLNAATEALEQASISQKRQIDALGNELQRVRDDTLRELANRGAQRPWAEDLKRPNEEIKRHTEDLKHLAQAINEVDRKRAADHEEVLKILADLRKSVTGMAEAAAARPAPVRNNPEPRTTPEQANNDRTATPKDPAPAKAIPYTVGKGESLGMIVDSFNVDAKKKGYQPLTVQQVIKFNKITTPNKILEGTVLNLPLYPKS